MAYHGVLIPEAIAAMNVDSFNRSVVSSGCALDNGFVFALGSKNWTSGSGAEVFNIEAPASGNLDKLWMAYSGDEIVVTDSKYKGLDPDPRNFVNAAGKVFSAYKPQVGDIILVTAEVLSGSQNTYAIPAASSYQLAWSASAGSSLCYKYLQTSYISLATGAIGDQRVTAYELECIVA